MPLASKEIRPQIQYIHQYGGKIWYVDGVGGNDLSSGIYPSNALLTIGKAISVLSPGDVINVKAAVYRENGLNLNVNSTRVIFEIGSIIQPTVGTSFIVSGNNCSVKGDVFIYGVAGETVVVISGNAVVIEDISILGGELGFHASGDLIKANNLGAAQQTSIAFDFNGSYTRASNCKTSGDGYATIGFNISTGASNGELDNCISVNHGLAGFYCETGAYNYTILNCSSGGSDGRWVDLDNTNVFSNFTYDDYIHNDIDITQAEAGTWTYNLFKVSGVIRITRIEGVVTETLTGSNSSCYLDIYSANGGSDLSKNTDLTIGAALVGSVLLKLNKADKILTFGNACAGFLLEEIDLKKEGFKVGQDRTGDAYVDTYIRFFHTTDGTSSGNINWHVKWEPVSDDGFLEVA